MRVQLVSFANLQYWANDISKIYKYIVKEDNNWQIICPIRQFVLYTGISNSITVRIDAQNTRFRCILYAQLYRHYKSIACSNQNYLNSLYEYIRLTRIIEKLHYFKTSLKFVLSLCWTFSFGHRGVPLKNSTTILECS